MIVKDEEAFIQSSLRSVQGVVSEMIVVDTGSRDNTVQLAEEVGATIFKHPWNNDFSEARNFSLDQATGDWILILDADEELVQEDIPLLLNLVSEDKADAFSFLNINILPEGRICKHRNVRLYRRGNVHYEGIVHNKPIVRGEVALTTLRIRHYGYNLGPELMQKKYKRSEILLAKQVEENPKDTYARANLIRNYRMQQRWADLIRLAEDTLRQEVVPFDRQIMMNDLLYAYFATGNLDKAELLGNQGLQDNPCHLDMLYVMGGVMVRTGRAKEAIRYFTEFLNVLKSGKETPGLEALLIDSYGYEGRAWNNMGSCYFELGDAPAAERSYQCAIRCEPENIAFYKNLAGLYLKLKLLDQGEQILNLAVEKGIADEQVTKTLSGLQVRNDK